LFSSHSIDAGGLVLHAREHAGTGPTVVFTHGWLDHSHSFDWLAEALPPDWRLIALDFRGHGFSSPLPKGASHQFTDHVADLEACVRHFGLERLHLVGHSMGGNVALAWCAARPGRVQSLTLIESLGTTGGKGDRAVSRIRDFAEDLFKPVRRRVYASVEEAAARVAEANSSYSPQSALLMAKWGTTPVEGGVVFTADPLLKRTSGMAFDESQVLALLAAVDARVQIIRGSNGMVLGDEVMNARVAALKNPRVAVVEGGHHVHLDRPREVAEWVRAHVMGG
jgi:pimeloyl-ACP methyl ester carboxylesterase